MNHLRQQWREAAHLEVTRLYHISPTRNRASIERDGLTSAERYQYVWGFSDLELAKAKAKGNWSGRGANDIWEIDTRGLPVISDPHPGWQEEFQGWWIDDHSFAIGPWVKIPPSRLKRYRDYAAEKAEHEHFIKMLEESGLTSSEIAEYTKVASNVIRISKKESQYGQHISAWDGSTKAGSLITHKTLFPGVGWGWWIDTIEVYDGYFRQGIATRMYEAACEGGLPVYHEGRDALRSEEAEVWIKSLPKPQYGFSPDEGQGHEIKRLAYIEGEWFDPGPGQHVEWHQDHRSLVEDAMHSWVGAPEDMRNHMAHELDNEGPPSSGTGKKWRAQAKALLEEARDHGKTNTRRLYRGATSPFGNGRYNLPTSWSTNKKTANKFARLSGGEVFVLEPGEGFGLRMSDYIFSQLNESEQQWLIWPRHP